MFERKNEPGDKRHIATVINTGYQTNTQLKQLAAEAPAYLVASCKNLLLLLTEAAQRPTLVTAFLYQLDLLNQKIEYELKKAGIEIEMEAMLSYHLELFERLYQANELTEPDEKVEVFAESLSHTVATFDPLQIIKKLPDETRSRYKSVLEHKDEDEQISFVLRKQGQLTCAMNYFMPAMMRYSQSSDAENKYHRITGILHPLKDHTFIVRYFTHRFFAHSASEQLPLTRQFVLRFWDKEKQMPKPVFQATHSYNEYSRTLAAKNTSLKAQDFHEGYQFLESLSQVINRYCDEVDNKKTLLLLIEEERLRLQAYFADLLMPGLLAEEAASSLSPARR